MFSNPLSVCLKVILEMEWCVSSFEQMRHLSRSWMFTWRIWLQIAQASVVQYLPATVLELSWKRIYCRASELDFYIWNANWLMKCEAKMAPHGGQSCTLYTSFSLRRDILHFPEKFPFEIDQNVLSKDRNESKYFKYISTKSNRVKGYIFSRK